MKLAIPEDALPPVAAGTVVTPAGSGPSGAPSSGSLTKDAGERRNYTLSTIGFGVAGAGLLVGSITGIIAINKAGDLKSQCTNNVCPLSLQQNIDSSKRLGTISSISFALAGVGTAVAIIGLILPIGRSTASAPSRPGVSPWIGLGIAGVEGRF